MKLNKREKTIAIAMTGVIAIWIFSLLAQPKKKTRKGKASRPNQQAQKPSPGSVSKGEVENKKEAGGIDPLEFLDFDLLAEQFTAETREIDIASLRDPFRKLDEGETIVKFSDLSLSGIFKHEDVFMALINDKILKAGDSIHGFTIIDIDQNEVKLQKGDEQYSLRLFVQTEEE